MAEGERPGTPLLAKLSFECKKPVIRDIIIGDFRPEIKPLPEVDQARKKTRQTRIQRRKSPGPGSPPRGPERLCGLPRGGFFTTRRPPAVKRRRGGMFEPVPRPGGPVMRSTTMRVSALAVLLAAGAAVLRRRRSMNRTASTARTPVARRDRIERSHLARADSDRTHGTAVRVARARGADLGAETPRGRGGEEGRASVRARDLGPAYLSSDGRILRSDARHLRLISGFLETVWSNVRRKVNQ